MSERDILLGELAHLTIKAQQASKTSGLGRVVKEGYIVHELGAIRLYARELIEQDQLPSNGRSSNAS